MATARALISIRIFFPAFPGILFEATGAAIEAQQSFAHLAPAETEFMSRGQA
jgi:hypothetical protein